MIKSCTGKTTFIHIHMHIRATTSACTLAQTWTLSGTTGHWRLYRALWMGIWQHSFLGLLYPKTFLLKGTDNTSPRSCTKRPPLSPSTWCRKVVKEIVKVNGGCRGNHSFACHLSGPVGLSGSTLTLNVHIKPLASATSKLQPLLIPDPQWALSSWEA